MEMPLFLIELRPPFPGIIGKGGDSAEQLRDRMSTTHRYGRNSRPCGRAPFS